MTAMKQITPEDIIDTATYTAERKAHKARQREIKQNRRVDVGPFVSFYFENRDTMWHQIQEMLYIERAGPSSLPTSWRPTIRWCPRAATCAAP